MFDASRSHPCDEEATFTWDFGDGSPRNGMTTSYVFDQTGEYEVTLNVTTQEEGDTLTQPSRSPNLREASTRPMVFLPFLGRLWSPELGPMRIR